MSTTADTNRSLPFSTGHTHDPFASIQSANGMPSDAPMQVVLSFSGGKDSCLALHALQQDPGVCVTGLLTTVGMPYQRVSHHGVRRSLLNAQAQAVGLPLTVIELESTMSDCTTMANYESQMRTVMDLFLQQGVEAVAFGDLYLEDLKAYRQARNNEVGMGSAFPLWGQNTKELAHRFVRDGFQAIVTCVDTTKLPGSFAGRCYDEQFLADLAEWPEVDPCGENGEFHSFVFDGPVFAHPVACRVGQQHVVGNRTFADVLPADGSEDNSDIVGLV